MRKQKAQSPFAIDNMVVDEEHNEDKYRVLRLAERWKYGINRGTISMPHLDVVKSEVHSNPSISNGVHNHQSDGSSSSDSNGNCCWLSKFSRATKVTEPASYEHTHKWLSSHPHEWIHDCSSNKHYAIPPVYRLEHATGAESQIGLCKYAP
jgi:hypothetical protein